MHDQAIDLLQTQTSISERHASEFSHLVEMEHARRAGVFFWFVLSRPNQGRLALQSHESTFLALPGASRPELVAIFCCIARVPIV